MPWNACKGRCQLMRSYCCLDEGFSRNPISVRVFPRPGTHTLPCATTHTPMLIPFLCRPPPRKGWNRQGPRLLRCRLVLCDLRFRLRDAGFQSMHPDACPRSTNVPTNTDAYHRPWGMRLHRLWIKGTCACTQRFNQPHKAVLTETT